MIPKTITPAHIRAALAVIDRDGVPRAQHGRSYELVYGGNRYPPKYTVALAGRIATGSLLDSESFGGGVETNAFLDKLGFTIVAKGASPTPRPIPGATPTGRASSGVRVGRVFLNLGIRQGVYQKRPEGKAKAFENLSYGQFKRDPSAYRERIVGLIHRAHREGSKVVVLPACALQVYKGVTLEDYAVSDVPLMIAGVSDNHRESAVVFRHGVVSERFDSTKVHWVDAEGFTLMTAISSTIGKAIESRFEPPVLSTSHPPDPSKPVLIADVGHSQYSSRYDFNTLRCVARDVAARVGQPTGLVLSSWMWSTRGIGERWCHPPERMQVQRLPLEGEDIVDVIDVNLASKLP